MGEIMVSRITELCRKHGITQAELAETLGFSASSFAKWKSGTISPSLATTVEIARYFNVSIDYLVGNTDIQSNAGHVIKDRQIITLQRAKENSSEKDLQKLNSLLEAVLAYADVEPENDK